jgi:hypothetical protein
VVGSGALLQRLESVGYADDSPHKGAHCFFPLGLGPVSGNNMHAGMPRVCCLHLNQEGSALFS